VDFPPHFPNARPGRDPAAEGGDRGIVSCTPCGIEIADGPAAWQTLRPELELSGKISGRDLVRERLELHD
jgi:hypothetical protein